MHRGASWHLSTRYPEWGFIIQPRIEAPGFRGCASTLGQPVPNHLQPCKWLHHQSRADPRQKICRPKRLRRLGPGPDYWLLITAQWLGPVHHADHHNAGCVASIAPEGVRG